LSCRPRRQHVRSTPESGRNAAVQWSAGWGQKRSLLNALWARSVSTDEGPLHNPSARLPCQFQDAVRKRSGIASQCRHIDCLRPAISRAVVGLAVATCYGHKSSAALLNRTGLCPSCCIARLYRVHAQSLPFHRPDDPALQSIVRGMDNILAVEERQYPIRKISTHTPAL
jgi:hypothetical protein